MHLYRYIPYLLLYPTSAPPILPESEPIPYLRYLDLLLLYRPPFDKLARR